MLSLKQVRITNFLTQIWHNKFLKKLMALLSLSLDFYNLLKKESITSEILNFLIIFRKMVLLLLLLDLLELTKIHLLFLTLTLFLKIIKRFQLKYRLFYLIRKSKRLELFLNLMLGSLKFSTLMKCRNSREI